KVLMSLIYRAFYKHYYFGTPEEKDNKFIKQELTGKYITTVKEKRYFKLVLETAIDSIKQQAKQYKQEEIFKK
ncbi:8337_t:CDS:1, partial [Dentiscutata erythropus]